MGKGTLTIRVVGDAAHLSQTLKDGEGALSKFGSFAKTALVGVGAAVAATAVKSVADFSGFERQMNEVFTLLPGISQDAMSKMEGQVKDFSREFGVLPNETVPALYQAISAGVPQDNVFEFLETAQKAARGGVTELTTAVDGISSVVNAYGDKIGGAAEASDLMFTAVRLGKTNFEQLSQSLFNVNPIAAALGVQFGDVTAAIATMTAQGVPTSVATTQLRQAFVELSKEGGKTAETFEKVAGKSFKEFIAEGGNTQTALQLLEEYAKKTGVGVNDLFGSVEAGSAALALTGDGTEAFTGALDEMGSSAGATEAAFEQMEQGIGPVFDKIRSTVSVWLLDVGEMLTEKLQPHIDKALELFGKIRQWWNDNKDAIKNAIGDLASAAKTALDKIISAGKFVLEHWDAFKTAIIVGVAIMTPHWVALGVAATVSAATQVAAWIATKAQAIAAAVVHSAQVAIMVAKWAFMGAQATFHALKIAAAWVIAMGPVAWVIAAVVGLAAVVITNWDTIKEATGNLKDMLVGALQWIANRMFDWADFVLGLADKAFGWIPGLGPKLEDARKKLAEFRDKTNGILDGIKDRTIKVQVDQEELARQIEAANAKIGELLDHDRTIAVRYAVSGGGISTGNSGAALNPGNIGGATVRSTQPSTGRRAQPRAHGGPIWPGQDFLVGEEGPELVRFGRSGTVVPADKTAAMLGGGARSAPVVNVTVNVEGNVLTERDLTRQVASAITVAMAESVVHEFHIGGEWMGNASAPLNWRAAWAIAAGIERTRIP